MKSKDQSSVGERQVNRAGGQIEPEKRAENHEANWQPMTKIES
jgi:hypothetical protein